jgi:hypothetical protein
LRIFVEVFFSVFILSCTEFMDELRFGAADANILFFSSPRFLRWRYIQIFEISEYDVATSEVRFPLALLDDDGFPKIFAPRFSASGCVEKILTIPTQRGVESWLSALPHKIFCRVSRSCLLNVDFVRNFEPDIDGHGGRAYLEYGLDFRVSRKYLADFHRATEYRFATPIQKRNARQKRRAQRGGG